MSIQLTDKAKEIIALSRQEAIKANCSSIRPLHILLGILQYESCLAYKILTALEVPIAHLRIALEKTEHATHEEEPTMIKQKEPIQANSITLDPSVSVLLKLTQQYAKVLQSKAIGTEHMLLATLKNMDTNLLEVLESFGVTYEKIEKIIIHRLGEYYVIDNQNRNMPIARSEDATNETAGDPPNKHTTMLDHDQSLATPILNSCGKDLSKLAAEGKLVPVIGRKKEIERVMQILIRCKKNNALLIGEPGVGKTAIAEGLALAIMQGKVAKPLLDKRVISLDIATLIAGTKYRGQFEERMKGLIQELTQSNQFILFIDEIHTIVGAGSASGSLDVANILKPALARGEIQCIGATTLSEYKQHIEKDGALTRRFQTVQIEQTTIKETVAILHALQPGYETYHAVSYTPEVLEACANFSAAYISNRLLPDKAIDIMDEVGARVKMHHWQVPIKITKLAETIESIKVKKNHAVQSQLYEEAAQLRDQEKKLYEKLAIEKTKLEQKVSKKRYPVSCLDVAAVVAETTGIPIERIMHQSNDLLLHLSKHLKAEIIGQDNAIEKVSKSLQRAQIGLQDSNRPLGVFMFLGPTGVGKTALAKTLARQFFNNPSALIRLDMSEYMEKFTVSRLIGAPPGYVGYEEGGQLTEKIRNHPYSVILLDEIEKAHSDVYNILLQMMDEGILTDGLGRKIDCRHAIIIMTSNVGAKELDNIAIGFQGNEKPNHQEVLREKVQKALQSTFSPEFINRLDDVIVFHSLTPKDIDKIVKNQLVALKNRVKNLGYHLIIKKNAIDFLGKKGYDAKYGIRPLKRVLQNYVEDAVTQQIIQGKILPGETLVIDKVKEADHLRLTKKK